MKHEKKFKMKKIGKSYSNPSGAIWTGGTIKHLEHPGVRKAPGATLSEQGTKGDPFTSSNGKRLRKEINLQAHPSVAKSDVNKGFPGKTTFTENTAKVGLTQKREGASPRIKSVSTSKDTDFHSDTQIEQKVKGA